MRTRCKPGDIAVILFDEPECLGNVGRLVRVHPTLQLNRELNLGCWLIVPLTDDDWFVSMANGSICTYPVGLEDRIEHPDAWMLPIQDKPRLKRRVAITRKLEVLQ